MNRRGLFKGLLAAGVAGVAAKMAGPAKAVAEPASVSGYQLQQMAWASGTNVTVTANQGTGIVTWPWSDTNWAVTSAANTFWDFKPLGGYNLLTDTGLWKTNADGSRSEVSFIGSLT